MGWYDKVETEEEALSYRSMLLKDGEYKCIVVDAMETTSKSGNGMIKLTLQVMDKQYKLFAYLVGSKKMQWFVRHFCESAGLMDKYLNDTFTHTSCVGKVVKAIIKTRPEQKNDDGSVKYKEQNYVEDFVKHSEEQVIDTVKQFFNEGTAQDDDIPF